MSPRSQNNVNYSVGKKLPVWWTIAIYASMGIFCLGKWVYGWGWLDIATKDNCVIQPDGLDVFITSLTNTSGWVMCCSVLFALVYLQKGDKDEED